jgi:hypothetical protein
VLADGCYCHCQHEPIWRFFQDPLPGTVVSSGGYTP